MYKYLALIEIFSEDGNKIRCLGNLEAINATEAVVTIAERRGWERPTIMTHLAKADRVIDTNLWFGPIENGTFLYNDEGDSIIVVEVQEFLRNMLRLAGVTPTVIFTD